MSHQDLTRARKKVKKKKGFFVHLGVYLSVALFFFLINILSFDGELWFFWPMLPWGVGLAIHYLTVFGLPGTDILTQEWESRQLEQELYRLRREKGEGGELDQDRGEALDLNAPIRKKVPRYEDPDEEEFV